MVVLGEAALADAAITGGALFGLFNYNRGNYMYDSTFRYERFTAGREFAIAQAEMYRQDLRALSALTQKKNTIYAIVSSLCMALCVALYCAGRLGLHGPSPPAWIMGLWYTNNAASFSFMALGIWLSTHAAFRAQSASVHLLTRKTRVPVPTLKQLDKARRFASEFEQQSWGDIFRVPYITNNGAPKTDEAAQAMSGKGSSRSHSAPPGRRTSRASTWVREEFETDRAGTVTGGAPVLPVDAAPEHFRLYTQVQKEWFQYDIYARVTILLGILSFVHALGYYGLGHINIELRAFWVAYATGFILMVLHALLLRFDIIQGRTQNEMLPHCQWLGPLAWLPAAIGMSLDFQVHFSMTAVIFCWVCIFVSYILQFVYTLRLLELVLPDDWRAPFRPEERIGSAWWPESWRVPSSFQHVLYLVAPPSKLQPGQHDIYREVKEGTVTSPEDAGRSLSPRSGAPPQENLLSQMEYVDNLFEWAFQEAVFNRLSRHGKDQLRKLYAGYDDAKKRQHGTPTADSELVRVSKECVTGINAIITDEGMQPLSGGEGSGYESTGTARSGSGGSDAEMGGGKGRVDARHNSKAVAPFTATRQVEPWRLVFSILLVLAISWVFLICGCIVDVILGEQALVTAPHWSRPPMTRLSLEPHELGTPIGFPWPAGSKPWIPEQMAWHEEKREAEKETLGARRLSAGGELAPAGGGVASSAAGLSAAVDNLMAALARGTPGTQAAEPVSWPGFFEPRLLACGPALQGGGNLVAALTPRGFGATAHVGRVGERANIAAEPFALAGLSHLPPLLSASWGPAGAEKDGLTLVSRAGHVLTCPGPRPAVSGAWACAPPAGAPLALPAAPGARLAAAAAAWLSSPAGGAPRLHAALVDEAVPELVALFVQDGEGEAASWLPLGEVQVPVTVAGMTPRTSLSFAGDGDLIVATDAGALLRRRLGDGAVLAAARKGWGSEGLAAAGGSWQAACGLQHGPAAGKLAHLHLRKEPNSHVRRPELITALLKEGRDFFFN